MESNIKRLESVQKYLFAYAFHLCGNVNDSKDLVQDANIRILDNLDKFRYGDNYLFCIQTIIFQLVVMYYFSNR